LKLLLGFIKSGFIKKGRLEMVFLNILFILILGVFSLILFYSVLLGYQYYEKKGQSSKKSRYFVEQCDASILHKSNDISVDNEENNILQAIPSYKEVFDGSNSTANPVEMIRPQSFEASDHSVIQWLNSLKMTHQKNQEYLRKESAMPIFSMLKK